MDQIIIKANLLSKDSNLIPLVRWLFPECQIHVVPPEYTLTPDPEANSPTVPAEMKAHQGA
jgi:hypothetical protein